MAGRKKPNNKYTIKQITETDVNILKLLYQYRVLTVEQVNQFMGLSDHYIRRKLNLLLNTNLIFSNPISGGYRDQKRQGSAYQITGHGITVLRGHGIDVPQNADALRIPKKQLVYLLTSYDIAFELLEYGWTFEQSRHVKSRLNLDRQGVLRGLLTSPAGADWLFFITLKDIAVTTVHKMKKDMESCGRYREKVIFTKGLPAFKLLIKFFIKEETILRLADSCKIIPPLLTSSYLRFISTDEEFFSFIGKLGYPVKQEDQVRPLERWKTYDGYCAVNLIDTDLVKVYNILGYNSYHLERIRGFKVFTTPSLAPVHQELLAHLPHVHFELIDIEIFEQELAN